MGVVLTQPAIDAILSTLDSQQRAAAELPDGPALIIAPAGSGKTTTLVARLGVLLARGVPPEHICVVTFQSGCRARARRANRYPARAACSRRRGDRGPDATRHGPPGAARRWSSSAPAERPDVGALDTIVSAWKVEGRPPPPEATATVDAFAALMAIRGQIDFDDLVEGAVAALEADQDLRSRWQARIGHLCVDEFQDVDAAQLRLVRLLAAPEDNLFVVGDDDQWLARRLLRRAH